MNKNTVIFRTSLINGLITGVIFSVIIALLYLLDLSILWFTMVFFAELIIIVFAIILTIKSIRRSLVEQSLSYLNRFLSGLVVGVVAGWVAGLFSYLLFQIIDPDYMLMKMEGFAETLMDWGVPEENAYKSVDDMKEGFQPIEQLKSNLLKMPAFYAVVSLIVSAFVKGKKAEDIETV